MIGDKTPYFAIYDAQNFNLVYSFSEEEIANIDVTIEKGADIDGQIVLAKNSSNVNTINSIKQFSHFARIGYGELYPVIIMDKDDSEIGVSSITIKGFKEYANYLDVYPYYLADVQEKKFTNESTDDFLYFYGNSVNALITIIFDNLKRTMAARGYNTSYINHDYFKNNAGNGGSVTTKSYRLSLVEYTSLNDVLEDIYDNNALTYTGYEVKTSQNINDSFSFILTNQSTANKNNDTSIFSNVKVSLERPDYAHVVYGIGKSFTGSTIVDRGNIYTHQGGIYTSSGVEVNESKNESLKTSIDRKKESLNNYQGTLSFTSFEEFSLGDRINLPAIVYGMAGISASYGYINTKNIDEREFSYEVVFNYNTDEKPQNIARRAIVGSVENAESKAKKATKKSNSSGVRW